MSCNNFTIPPSDSALPPLPPINNTIVGSGTAAADLPKLASIGNAHVGSLADEFLNSRSHDSAHGRFNDASRHEGVEGGASTEGMIDGGGKAELQARLK